jgi:protein involved in polysaccharide export with SLBB domain
MEKDQINRNVMGFHRKLLLAIIPITLIIQSIVLSQNKQETNLLEDKTQQRINLPSMPIAGPALEGPIDPDKYVLGPSDVLGVNIWSIPPLNFVITVTPEGSIIVPSVGEIRIAGLSLTSAKDRILAEIHKKFLIGNATVTLLDIRDIVVTITGNVRRPGRYKMTAAERVDRLLQEANQVIRAAQGIVPAQTAQTEENPSYNPAIASKRAIVLRRRDGTTRRVDIQEFYATKNEDRDPFLLGGDEVFVPRTDEAKNLFAVYGAVNAPGRFEYIPGDSVYEAIKLAYGFTQRANLDSVELVRLDPQTGSLSSTTINAKELTPGSPKNFSLEPGDRILVREQFDQREDYRVFLEGEVKFPGIYPITKDKTRLSQVIREAGGFTEFASLQSAQLLRNSVTIDDGQLNRMLLHRGNITPEDNAYVSVEGDIQVRRFDVNVNFEKLFLLKDSTEDILIVPEDRIVIPSAQKTVHVFGQVVTPGNIPFIVGKDAQYYIMQSGGFTDDAERGDVAIIKWTTRKWFEPGKTQIEEGDYIWVPPVVRRPASYWLAIIGQTTSIISVALSIVILVVQLKK